MGLMVETPVLVTAGVDTHRDNHVAAALDQMGRVLATASFPATGSGFVELTDWLSGFGELVAVGVEGTGSYGAGLARYLAGEAIEVREVIRPNRQHRRRYGKADHTDAVAAGRAVQSGEASAKMRHTQGGTESLRMLRIARSSAVKSQTMVGNQIRSVLATGPIELAERFAAKSINAVAAEASRLRPRGDLADPVQATKTALQSLGRRHQALREEIDQLGAAIDQLVSQTAPPPLLDECGIGPINATDLLIAFGSNPDRVHSEAAFAALCGVSPVDASSGRQQRHRLNRGGDRQANAALYRAVITRLRYHQPTREYMTRRLSEGLTKPEVIRCLKRALARRIYKILTHHQTHT